MLSKRVFLDLRLRVISPITRLPFFHGPHWSALLRHVLRPALPEGQGLAEAGIAVQSVESGITAYAAGDAVHLGLDFPAGLERTVLPALARFEAPAGPFHFRPGESVRLESACCRFSGAVVLDGERREATGTPRPVGPEDLLPEVQALMGSSRFRFVLRSPLRLKRPVADQRPGHVYCDEEYFRGRADSAMAHVLGNSRLWPEGLPEGRTPGAGLRVVDESLVWLDVPYGKESDGKTPGGVVGTLWIEGDCGRDSAEALARAAYWGLGKGPVFGFGFGEVEELAGAHVLAPLSRGRTLLARSADPEALRSALSRVSSASAGPDGITGSDLRAAGEDLLARLSRKLEAGTWRHGAWTFFDVPKPDGGVRRLAASSLVDRLVQRTLADTLAPAVDTFLSTSAFAYRQGLNVKGAARALRQAMAEGYSIGIKADIAAFFDSVDTQRLGGLLAGLLPAEPYVHVVRDILTRASEQGIPGLPQGSPLSPLLSNLYLHRFDTEMAREGLRLIRYADDFAVLARGQGDEQAVLETVERSLARLGLALNRDKVVSLRPGESFEFLGQLVSLESVTREQPAPEAEADSPWPAAFRYDWGTGRPVYLTCLNQGAYSSGPDLVVRNEDGDVREIPWSGISRIVVVGRSHFSGGLAYQAVKRGIPLSFIDVLGRMRGMLGPEPQAGPKLAAVQKERAGEPGFVLDVARRLVGAKIGNSRALLRRNGIDAPGLETLVADAESASDLDSLRGVEGAAAREYFGYFAGLVAPFEFNGRTYRPPDGPVNAMLSFGYTMLYSRLAAALVAKGFDPRIGFLHQPHGRHMTLASDIMEPLRHLVDRVVLACIHRKEIAPEHFGTSRRGDTDFCRLDGEGFRVFLRAYERTMGSAFTPPGHDHPMTYNSYLDEAVDAMRRSLVLEIPYKPLRIR